MLVLSRKSGQSVILGGCVEVTVLRIRGNVVKLGICGPETVPVRRSELLGEHPSRPKAEVNGALLRVPAAMVGATSCLDSHQPVSSKYQPTISTTPRG
jgi:carbon storage regulator